VALALFLVEASLLLGQVSFQDSRECHRLFSWVRGGSQYRQVGLRLVSQDLSRLAAIPLAPPSSLVASPLVDFLLVDFLLADFLLADFLLVDFLLADSLLADSLLVDSLLADSLRLDSLVAAFRAVDYYLVEFLQDLRSLRPSRSFLPQHKPLLQVVS
jgi:hypothetical protein